MKRLIALATLAGCSVAEPPVPPQANDTCGAGAFTALIGQDATVLETVLLLGPVRVIRPGDAVTMDYLRQRVNFVIAENETIQRVDCG